MKRVVLVCALVLTTKTAAAEEEKLFCFVEHAAGFTTAATGTSWAAVSFKPDGRYHLRPATTAEREDKNGPGGRTAYFLSDDGMHHDTPCALDASRKNLFCDGLDSFRLNLETRRFVVFYLHGYVDGVKDRKNQQDKKNEMDDDDTPEVELGLCIQD